MFKHRKKKEVFGFLLLLLIVTIIAFNTTSCKSNDNNISDNEEAYNPAKPVVVSNFTPAEGGAYQKMVIAGDNFGTDTSLVKVTIGGLKATLINVKGNCLYCVVPSKAFSGKIEVSVGDSTNVQTDTASTRFTYDRSMVVGTLCGYRNQNDDQGWQDGSFATCCGFRDDGILKFDPLHKDHLYVCYDGGDIQMLDLTKRWLSTPMSASLFGNRRLRSIDFTLDGKYMLVAVDADEGTGTTPSVFLVTRNADGTFNNESSVQVIAAYKQCNGASIHPINGELYFNSYERGQVFRLDMNNYFETIANGGVWRPNYADGNYTQLFTIQDTGWEFKIFIHPSGKYAYIVVLNRDYILRTDYNEATKCFAPPYIVAGQIGQEDWADGVGTSARMHRPYQGVFVKNPDYVAEGKDDAYDFYFTDNKNFCVRCLTPDGMIKTYAGRGTASSVGDNNQWGTDDGALRTQARFRDVTGIAYDDVNNVFYILDTVGHTIRTISMEK